MQLYWFLFNNVAGLHRRFPVNFGKKLLRTPLSKNTCERSLLYLGTTLLENIAIRKEKKHSHNKVSYNYLGYATQADLNSNRLQYSHIFFILFCWFFICGKFESALVTCNV